MILKGFSLLFLGLGVFVLMQVVMPVLAFKVWEVKNYDQSQLLVDPKPRVLSGKFAPADARLPDGQVLGVSIEDVNNFPAFIGTGSGADLPYKEFKLTISKLKLYDTQVLVSSNNFETSLAQLPGTSLPGQKGNVFITGHSSILSKLSGKQIAFFATLPNIKKGDEVIATALGQKYTYEVMGMKVVDPKDVSVINPPDEEGRYLTLMTCVPPGFNTKRLVVLTRLKQT